VEIETPSGSSVLHVAGQGEEVCIWVEVEPDKTPTQKRTFFITGTGHDIENPYASYIGTAHCPPFVWHVYELVK
jgi:hypothetical protein